MTKLEFDTQWRSRGFNHSSNAPLFFEELDRVPDEVLNSKDFQHTFRLFDEDGKGRSVPKLNSIMIMNIYLRHSWWSCESMALSLNCK